MISPLDQKRRYRLGAQLIENSRTSCPMGKASKWETEYQKFERRNDIPSDSEAVVKRDKLRVEAFAIIGPDGLDNLEGYSPPWKERIGIFPVSTGSVNGTVRAHPDFLVLV